ncbi:topless-related protein 4-like isoform X2 [Diospyros lotus]|uniref:topless-related protein 4-like isoform X2 n=1 Tax=Diospyros lotus TaxID=55363 RepID=UPI00225565DF|nr:topless-related protein 4-like isoform X2 [Diospyros lotus]
MSSLSQELIFLILQFLDEENYKETAHNLEKESGIFFNVKYFEDSVNNGDWDEVEKYLSAFTKMNDNRYSMKIFFEISKQKYLETLDRHDLAKAAEILLKDLKPFSTFNEDLFKDMTLLLALGNFRENRQLSAYGDAKSARAAMLTEVTKLIEANPLLHDKLQFPRLNNSRLRTLINQSLNWQHELCKHPKPNPDIKTLFMDHSCPEPTVSPLMNSMPEIASFAPLGAHGGTSALTAYLGGWMANASFLHQDVSAGPVGTSTLNNADPENVLTRSRPFGTSDEVHNRPINVLPVRYPTQSPAHTMYSTDDLPKMVVANLNQGSVIKSMDFHPVEHNLLLVGTEIGDIALWEVGSRERLVLRNFRVWDIAKCSVVLQAALANEHTASVNRVMWSPDGNLFGVAYSKHIVHLYTFHGSDDIRNHLEIDAHTGNVNDLAFSQPKKCIITCGEDKTIKVWDAATGYKKYTMEGHLFPVYSVCPHNRENIQFILSTGTDGKIKAWLYDNFGSRVDYDAPGHTCTTMAYSSDGMRLFSCGTSKEGESYIAEWNESEGIVKRTYHGLAKKSVGIVQFDTARNKFLAAGDEFVIKFWDMDDVNLLTTSNAEGGLPASPCLRFNKEGKLLAVSTSENGFKILANAEAVRRFHPIGSHAFDPSRITAKTAAKTPIIGTYATSSSAAANVGVADRNAQAMAMMVPVSKEILINGENRPFPGMKPRTVNELEQSKIWKLSEIAEPSELHSLRLPDNLQSVRVARLIYTNSGQAILALCYNAVHKFWKWTKNGQTPTRKATTSVLPHLWQPSSTISMTNDISDTNLEDAVPCFALSKNDSYVVSTSGGKISLFNVVMLFEVVTSFLPPPPAATFIAFHPQDNNIIVIGMEDSSIQIYNIRTYEVKRKLRGHHRMVTGLAFSTVLNILVSSGADAQLCVWNLDGWKKQACKFLQIPSERMPAPVAQTRVQFHQNQVHVLVAHKTHLAIYEAVKLECLKKWVPGERSGSITDAAYSCDSRSVYVGFEDGSINVLTATLKLKCRIDPNAYLPSSPCPRAYPLVIAAHPSLPNQFALGLTDGGVHVLEPLKTVGKWGTSPPPENGAGPSTAPVAAASDQPSK